MGLALPDELLPPDGRMPPLLLLPVDGRLTEPELLLPPVDGRVPPLLLLPVDGRDEMLVFVVEKDDCDVRCSFVDEPFDDEFDVLCDAGAPGRVADDWVFPPLFDEVLTPLLEVR